MAHLRRRHADIVRFFAYEILFVAVPGAALLWALRGRSGFLVTVSLGWPLGQTLEILAFVATAAIGVRWLFDLFPVVIVAFSALLIWRRRRAPPAGARESSHVEHLAVGAARPCRSPSSTSR